MSGKAPVRLAVVGGHRGATFQHSLAYLSDRIRLVAVCDKDETVLQRWKAQHPDLRSYSDYDRLLDDADVDAVFLATPLFIHAQQAIKGLRAGKHVVSEVIAAHTLEDGWELVETVERSGNVYMMAENYCYMRPNMMVKHMAERGLFGEITHAEGAYIHDCRALTHDAAGRLTWRGELQKQFNGMNYPTHSLGPVAQWLGVGKEGGDRFESIVTFVSQSASAQKYYRDVVGADHPGARIGYWNQGDSAVSLIRTERGAVIVLRVDWISSRPHNMTHYALQGTNGAYVSARHGAEEPLVWLEGVSPGVSWSGKHPATWETLWKYADAHEHPLWRRWRTEAESAGHGGGDFFVLGEFADAIRERRRPAIDVYDAVAWSAVFPLSGLSVAANGRTIPFPDFRQHARQRAGAGE